VACAHAHARQIQQRQQQQQQQHMQHRQHTCMQVRKLITHTPCASLANNGSTLPPTKTAAESRIQSGSGNSSDIPVADAT